MALVVQNDDGTAQKATGTLTFTGQPANAETVVLGATTYTFKTTLTGAANEVLRGADATAARDNLVAAINNDAGTGTLYGTGTGANASATAAASGDNLLATSLHPGEDANDVATTASSSAASWGASTLTGGASVNSYITLAYFKSYHDARGNDYSAKTDPQIEQAIARAFDYIDTRFDFEGRRLTTDQTSEFPRKAGSEIVLPWYDINFLTPQIDIGQGADTFVALVGPSGEEILGVPSALKRAHAEYSFRALTILLFQDAPAPEGGRLIDEQSVKVDVIEQSIKYASSQGGGNFVLPAYPTADMWLVRAGLIKSGRTLLR